MRQYGAPDGRSGDGIRAPRTYGETVSARSAVVALARSCHPGPTVAVTSMATALAIAAGDSRGVVLLVAAAVLAGQLSIGWSNDLIDAERDRAAARLDKPVALRAVDRRVLVPALAVATVAVLPLSLALGWRAGVAHLVGVACGWLYNLRLKSTLLSPAAYAVAFGALPAVATLARPVPGLPPWWATATGALLGIGAHFGNVLPDIDDDLRAGVRGAPQRAGRLGSGIVAALACIAAAGLLLRFAGPPTVPSFLLGALVAALGALVVGVARHGRRMRAAFGATMLAAALCVVILVTRGGLAG